MTVQWTSEQVLSLAPDDASRKNASGLALSRRWKKLFKQNGSDQPGVVWGECQGSGADPYRCLVDLTGPAFKCTCPSRKLPCKHALGLFLLFATQPDAFETGEPPDWVAAWLAQRAEQNERRAVKAEERAPAPDPAARARQAEKRAAERDRKVRAGLDELETWLRDLLRQGLAAAQEQPGAFWETAAARLVDAQAPGLARMVRALPELAASGDGWQERVLDQVARLYLAIEGYRRIGVMPEETQADLRSLIGYNLKQEELLERPGVADTWLALGREVEEETNLRTQRVWLWGQATGRPALILSFAVGNNPLDASLTPGTAVPAELVFYPGAYPLRAIVRSRGAVQAPTELPGCATLREATALFAAALACYPWLERYPLALSSVWPLFENGEWALYDRENRRAPLARHFLNGWQLAALSGGQPIGVFGEWNGERLRPLSAWADGQFVAFRPSLEA